VKVFQRNETVPEGIPDMMILDGNVVGPLIEPWLFNKLKRTLVVTEESLWCIVRTSNFMVEALEPNSFPGGLRVSNIF